jgi:glycosyltransferase involved in cell wall biosynthesis
MTSSSVTPHAGPRLRVALAIHHFPPAYTAGAEWQAFRLARGLIARGHDIRVVTIEHVDRGAADGSVTWEDTTYQGVPVRRLAFDQARVPDRDGFEYRNLWLRDHLAGWLTELQPDLLHLYSGYLMTGAVLEAAEALDVPRLINTVDFWFMCRRITMLRSDGQVSELPIRPEACVQCLSEEQRRYRLLGQIAPGLMRVYYANQRAAIGKIEERTAYLRERLNATNLIITNSEFLRSAYVSFGVAPERVTFQRQGLDLPVLDPAELAKPSADELRVGYFGQIAPPKGIHVLVEAARRVADPRLRVRIYGDAGRFPEYTAQLKALIGDDSRITFAGLYRGPAEQAQVLRNLDVLVVPSIWYENSPNVILEAYAHRTPVIAADWGGMAEMVEPGRGGLKYPPGDSAALAALLARLLNEPELKTQLGREFPALKTLGQELDETETFYRQLTSAHAPRRGA